MKIEPNPQRHLLLLLFWTLIGLGLRFLNLTEKPLWTDEFSTIVFSLGNSFLDVPLDQVISGNELLQPLQPNPDASITTVTQRLFHESNHPPLYFLLCHFWLKLFSVNASGWVNSWAVRSLPALIGAFSIPLTYLVSWIGFRSRVVAQTATALMAVSPFGIYLAQEARHYTLPIIWILISLSCLMLAARYLRDRRILPLWLCIIWIVINGLGIATHYFFAFMLGAAAIVIAILGLVQSWRERGIWYPSLHWRRIWIVAAGTAATGLIWWPVLQNIQEGELTRWIYQGDRSGLAWLDPIGQAIAGWITMLYLLPIQAESQVISIASGIVLVLLVVWTVPKLLRGLRVQQLNREARLAVSVLATFAVAAIVLFFSVTYFFEADLTSAFRYNFVYFPAVVLLIGAGLASSWDVALQIAQAPLANVPSVLLNLLRVSNRKTVVVVWLLSLIGALTVVTNLGYQKTHRPDLVAADIQQRSDNPTLVAIPYRSHGQTGRLMGIALALQQDDLQPDQVGQTTGLNDGPLFLLAHDTQNPRSVFTTLRRSLNQLPRPLNLWLINFHEVEEQPLNQLLKQNQCEAETKSRSVDGYRYRLYRCTRLANSRTGQTDRTEADRIEVDRTETDRLEDE